jgi:hypothetical protein
MSAACAPTPIELRQTIDDSALVVVESPQSSVFDNYVVKSLPEEDFSRYKRVMITPVTLRISDDEWNQLTDDDRKTLFNDFQLAYREVFDDIALTNAPDIDTLIIHTYITKLVPSDPLRNFAPFIVGELDLGAAAFESEALDNTGRLVAIARGTYNGKPLLEGYTTWDVVRHAVREWLVNNKQLLRRSKII